MPHIIIEHSSNFSAKTVEEIGAEVPQIMAKITEGNFDLNQFKVRSHLFSKFLVGNLNEKNSSFIHVTIKILGGRSLEVRKKVAADVAEFLQKKCASEKVATRHDNSVDVIEMDRDVYQKSTVTS
jgi:5-carboxymethyl-2-hydroxymuconate isomerase